MATHEPLPLGTDSLFVLIEYNANSVLMILNLFWPIAIKYGTLIGLVVFLAYILYHGFTRPARTSPRYEEPYGPERHSRSRSRHRD